MKIKIFFLIICFLIIFSFGSVCIALDSLSKEDKLFYTNISLSGFITIWGISFWDYGNQTPKMHNENWFKADTKYGGADKMGHLFTAYFCHRGLAYLYEKWGYNVYEAACFGAISSFGLTTLMEIGDSFSDKHGFSYEDMVMNCIGAFTGYCLYLNSDLDDLIDLRVEYVPKNIQSDIITDYENMKFLIALKFSGITIFKNTFLEYFELHAGYYTRGYGNLSESNHRNIYLAVGINLSRILETTSNKISSFFNYYQMPYSYISIKDHEFE